MSWTEERVELLKKLWMEGLSASQIAAVLGEGVTRNAVIGKVHRLKLSGRAKPASSTPRARTAPRPAPRRPGLSGTPVSRPSISSSSHAGHASTISRPRPMGGGGGGIIGATALKATEEFAVEPYQLPQVQELDIPVEKRLTLLQLNEHTCKWPIGDPLTPDFYFCGNHSEEGKPYCEFHSRRAYHQIDKKRR